MSKQVSELMFFAVSFSAAMLLVLVVCFSEDLGDIKQLTGHNLASLQTLKANCEKSLPRDKQCQLFVVAHALEETK